jgi:hypothetical protein
MITSQITAKSVLLKLGHLSSENVNFIVTWMVLGVVPTVKCRKCEKTPGFLTAFTVKDNEKHYNSRCQNINATPERFLMIRKSPWFFSKANSSEE